MAEGKVHVFLNDKEVAALPQELLRKRVSLAGLLPAEAQSMETWKSISAKATTGGFLRKKNPSQDLLNHEAILYFSEETGATLGVFRRITKDMPQGVQNQLKQPSSVLPHVERVDIWTMEEPGLIVQKTT